jgi:hypothetical protein
LFQGFATLTPGYFLVAPSGLGFEPSFATETSYAKSLAFTCRAGESRDISTPIQAILFLFGKSKILSTTVRALLIPEIRGFFCHEFHDSFALIILLISALARS